MKLFALFCKYLNILNNSFLNEQYFPFRKATPGSAGPRRFNLPVSVARISVSHINVEAELIEIAV
jgi:hypothetical protein